jgi:hypothetical protein
MSDILSWKDHIIIYAHVDFKDGDERIFYIGAGSLRRPYDRVNRTSKWKAFVKELGPYGTVLLWTAIDVTGAKWIENELIGALKPPCNINGKTIGTYAPRPDGITDLAWAMQMLPSIAEMEKIIDSARRASIIGIVEFRKALDDAKNACAA